MSIQSAQQKELPMLKRAALQVVAGGSAGFVEVCIMQPLDVVKTRMQLGGGGVSILKEMKWNSKNMLKIFFSCSTLNDRISITYKCILFAYVFVHSTSRSKCLYAYIYHEIRFFSFVCLVSFFYYPSQGDGVLNLLNVV